MCECVCRYGCGCAEIVGGYHTHLVTCVVKDQIHHYLKISFVHFLEQLLPVRHGAKLSHDVVVVTVSVSE